MSRGSRSTYQLVAPPPRAMRSRTIAGRFAASCVGVAFAPMAAFDGAESATSAHPPHRDANPQRMRGRGYPAFDNRLRHMAPQAVTRRRLLRLGARSFAMTAKRRR